MDVIKREYIENNICTIRGVQVMIDYHLAELYGVETRRLNEQVKRNAKRFPKEFMFRLTAEEWANLRSQIATTNQPDSLRSQNATAKRRTLPYVFTEQGVSMLSAVLNSDQAIDTSIQIMQAFVNMRKFLLNNASVFQRLDQLELKQLQSDEKFHRIFKALEAGQPKPDKGIFFNGQVFDAYAFVSDVIKNANKDIVLIDNYIDESIFTLLAKRKVSVAATVYTKKITKHLHLDAQKHAQQYPAVILKELKNAHDRFLIIDQKHLYHIGASLKDLGKKWFAFSQMDELTSLMLNHIKSAE